ncbi:YjjG family noncanonical pyrimidine nucleotidase [Clostridium sp. JNZ J1-5]
MKYELIIFDADETLLDFKRAEEDAFENTMAYFNLDYSRENYLEAYREINEAVWDEFEKELISAEDLKVERFKRFFKAVNLDLDPKKANELYMDKLCKSCFVLDGAVDILRELQGNFKLALVTNGLVDVQDVRIRQSEIAKFFHTIVISEEIGVAKPNPEIFKYTFKKVGHMHKETALVVGDSLKSDIKCGISFGIDTCWFNPKRLQNDTDIKPVYEINSLEQLKDIVFR